MKAKYSDVVFEARPWVEVCRCQILWTWPWELCPWPQCFRPWPRPWPRDLQ